MEQHAKRVSLPWVRTLLSTTGYPGSVGHVIPHKADVAGRFPKARPTEGVHRWRQPFSTSEPA